MPTIQLRNVPEKVYLDLKQCAEASKRSMNQEAIHLLEAGLRQGKIDPMKVKAKGLVMQKLKKMQETNPVKVDSSEILSWISEDRDR
jgi:plasmid stability protein